jgi:hypothetical protein
MVPVKGTVTLDGKPIAAALVKFVPKQATAEAGHEATAMTDDAGRFSLGTLKDGDGAWRGVYKVCVEKIVMDTAGQAKLPEGAPEGAKDAKGAALNRRQVMQSMRYRKNIFPKKYMNSNTTPLEMTVPTSGPADININSE